MKSTFRTDLEIGNGKCVLTVLKDAPEEGGFQHVLLIIEGAKNDKKNYYVADFIPVLKPREKLLGPIEIVDGKVRSCSYNEEDNENPNKKFNSNTLDEYIEASKDYKKCTFMSGPISEELSEMIKQDIAKEQQNPPKYCRTGGGTIGCEIRSKINNKFFSEEPYTVNNCLTWVEKIINARGIVIESTPLALISKYFYVVPEWHIPPTNEQRRQAEYNCRLI